MCVLQKATKIILLFKINIKDAYWLSGHFTFLSEECLEVLIHRLITQNPNPSTYGIHFNYMLGNILEHI